MTRRQIYRRAFDAEHKALMLKVRNARGIARVRALNQLKEFVAASLRSGGPSAKPSDAQGPRA